MSNKVVYSCDMSDEGSDMDVSDNEDHIQITRSQAPPQQVNNMPKSTLNSLPHEGMVTSLHRYMQRDSWGANAIKPMAEKKLKHKPVPTNNSSYASVVTGRKRTFNPDEEDDCLSDDSFHTAPSSPQPLDSDDFEPGQIADPPTQDELTIKIEALELKLKGYAELEEQIKEKLNVIRARKEELRIRRLQREVRQSILKNRKPTVKSTSDNKVKSLPSKILQEIDEEDSSAKEVTPPPLSKHAKKVLREEAAKKRKSKKRLRSPPAEEVDEDVQDIDVNSSAVEDQDEVELAGEDEEEEMEAEDGGDEDDDDDDDEDDGEDSDPEEGQVLVGKSLNFRQEKRMLKRLRALAQWEKTLSPEERELIKPDGPAYQSIDKSQSKHLTKIDRKKIEEYLTTQPLSLKHMRLILYNFKQASMEKQLTFLQEQFVIVLAKVLTQYIHAYETLEEPYYTEAVNDKPKVVPQHKPLEPEFYGNWKTLNFDGDDVDNYELYKCIRHFESLVNKIAMKRARLFLLKTGDGSAKGTKLRTSDPVENVPSVIALQNDPTLCRRVAQMATDLDKVRKKELAVLRKARKMNSPNIKNHSNRNRKRKKNKPIKPIKPNMPKPNPINARVGRAKFDKARAIETQALKAEVAKVTFDLSAAKANAFKHPNPRKPQAVQDTPTNPSERLAIDNENDRLEKEIDYMATQISTHMHKSKKPKISHTTDATVSTGPQIPHQKNQEHQVESMHIDKDTSKHNTSKSKKSTHVKPHQPANTRPLLTSNTQQPHHNKNADFSPIKIVDNGSPQPNAFHHTTNQAQNTMPAPTRTAPVTSGSNNNNSSHYVPYRSALSSLGLGVTSSTTSAPAPQQPVPNKSATLCSAESSGGVCNDKSCRFTHFKDFI